MEKLWQIGSKNVILHTFWRSGREAERAGFENQYTARYRGFESHLLRGPIV